MCICTVPSGVDGGTASTENQGGLLKDLILQREKLILSIIFVLNQWPFFTCQAHLGIPENILKYTTRAVGHDFYSLLQQVISKILQVLFCFCLYQFRSRVTTLESFWICADVKELRIQFSRNNLFRKAGISKKTCGYDFACCTSEVEGPDVSNSTCWGSIFVPVLFGEDSQSVFKVKGVNTEKYI